MNIISAIKDDNLFRPLFGDDLKTWRRWLAALRMMYGLPTGRSARKTIGRCTGRDPKQLPTTGFDEALFLCGRRSGKSTIASVIAAYEAVLGPGRKALSPGEEGVVLVIAPSRRQAQKVKSYARAVFDHSDLLAAEVVSDRGDVFELRGNIKIEIGVADHRLIRGHTLIAAVVDEVCHLHVEESRIKNAGELIGALRPGLATTGGKLIAISSPYARSGWPYSTWKRCHANDTSDILVWQAPSRRMNPRLPKAVIDRAMQEDRAAARAEYLAEWRDDVAAFLPRDIIERVVARGRRELLPRTKINYAGFVDMSGGRGDSAVLAIGHHHEGSVIIDFIKEYRPPFSPQAVIRQMVETARRYGLTAVAGDAYAAEFCAGAFRATGLNYIKAKKAKSELYLELLPRLCSGEIELLDNPRLVDQLANLERKTRSGGRDSVDHPQGSHDDIANAVAGVSDAAARTQMVLGRPLF